MNRPLVFAVFFCFFGMVFQKICQNGRPGGREPPRSTSFEQTSRMVSVWGRTPKISFCDFCDLQKSRHLQKSRVTERHNRGTKRKLKSHQAQKKALRAFFGPGVRLQFSLCDPIVPLSDATFLQMTRLLQVIGSSREQHLQPQEHQHQPQQQPQ